VPEYVDRPDGIVELGFVHFEKLTHPNSTGSWELLDRSPRRPSEQATQF
jgi:hypothetical protein